jgi:type IV secretion system protein VirB10
VSEAVSIDGAANDGLPLVGEDHGNRGLWLGLGSIGLAGVLLFTALESNRRANAVPRIAPPRDFAVASQPGPGLVIPQEYSLGPYALGAREPGVDTPPQPVRLPPVRLTTVPPSGAGAPAQPSPTYTPAPAPPLLEAPDPGRSAPLIVYDMAVAAAAALAPGTDQTTPLARSTSAVAAAAVDRSRIVPQGTLIYAVLETALDSTQSGQVRAILSNDVYNSSGTRILIPKGSRVFGEYKGEIASGQNRAQIVWGRLIRPDGVTISLDSPASDQLGRAGIRGKVDTHFGERLLGALLQSTIDFGVLAASRAVTSESGVVVALPRAAQSAGSQLVQEPPKPTLRVKHGTRIAVFVSRDLDFSGVD